jgi:hypothetical protein
MPEAMTEERNMSGRPALDHGQSGVCAGKPVETKKMKGYKKDIASPV